jgi:hypothetical protein
MNFGDGSSFQFIQHWYAAQCNGDWEHEFGIRIEAIDNPGWCFEVDIVDTDLEGRTLERKKRTRAGSMALVLV